MDLLLDADGLIKLNRAGVLERVLEAFSCGTAQAVYDEVVTRGRERLYQDAETIETALTGRVEILTPDVRRQEGLALGAGEMAILALVPRAPGAIVVSDDRRFLSVLSGEGIPFVTPAAMLVVLVQRNLLAAAEAIEALERMRPMIRSLAYRDVREDLDPGRGTQ